MSKKMILNEHNFDVVTETLTEATDPTKKHLMISGTFLQANVCNKNRRVYSGDILEKAVSEYDKSYIKTRMALGEMNHPSSLQVNPERACILITEISKDGNNFNGRARVLETPMGNILSGLIRGGVRVGISSRGNGSVIEEGGISMVQPDYTICALDVVSNPSGPNCFLDALTEQSMNNFIWNTLEEDTRFLEQLKKDIKSTPAKRLDEAKLQAFQKFMDRLKTI